MYIDDRVIQGIIKEKQEAKKEYEKAKKAGKRTSLTEQQRPNIFTNKVAKLAEEEDHHPEIVLEWGNVTVSWWSHKIKGLHKNDFICASKTDDLFKE